MNIPLSEAARLAGVSRSAIQKSITRGRLSASRDSSGAWVVDVAELSRVYTLSQTSEGQSTDLSYEVSHLNALLSEVRQERDWLRVQLAEERGERQKLLVLLEHKDMQPVPPMPHSAPTHGKHRRTGVVLLLVLLGCILSLGLSYVLIRG